MKPTTPQLIDIKDWYISAFNNFESQLNGSSEIPFHRVRKEAISNLDRMGFPTRRDEEWKYTDIRPVLQNRYRFAHQAKKLSRQVIQPFQLPEMSRNFIVFINGHFSPDLSTVVSNQPGCRITPLATALRNGNHITKRHLAKYADIASDPFTALNTAFVQEGMVIQVAEDVTLDTPIHILNISSPGETPFQAHPRMLVVAGKGSQFTILENRQHLSEAPYFQNSVTEIVAGENSTVNLISFQDESTHSCLINRTQVHQENNSNFSHVNIDMGGALVRNNLGMALNGENCQSNLYGLYLVSGRQHVDNHTYLDHLQPHCQSNELYKGILTDRARGIFSGTIYVARDAQKTNAFQSNRSLLLSEEAEIDSKPQLKIFADDVKCTHGATIGQIDNDAIFYFRQRGIDQENAHTLLRSAFAGEILEKIPNSHFRNFVQEKVDARLKADF